MEYVSLAIALACIALEAHLLFRALRSDLLAKYPVFFSYVAYVFLYSTLTLVINRFWPSLYASAYWFSFLIMMLAEFAVLVEASGHIFGPFPAIRRVGRLLTVALPAVLLLLYVVPAFVQPRPQSLALLDLFRRLSLVKAGIVLALLLAARFYGLWLGQNTSGMLLGFAFYLSVETLDLAAANEFGRALYENVFRFFMPVSYTVCLVVWTRAFWSYAPVPAGERSLTGKEEGRPALVRYQMGRFNTALERLLRK